MYLKPYKIVPDLPLAREFGEGLGKGLYLGRIDRAAVTSIGGGGTRPYDCRRPSASQPRALAQASTHNAMSVATGAIPLTSALES